MAFTLYDAVVPSAAQMLGTAAGLIDRAEAFCADAGRAPATLLGARLADDMLPFAYQVKSVAVHAHGAIEGVRRGEFNPDTAPPPADFAGLRARIAEAEAGLAAVTRDEMAGFVGREVLFAFGEVRIPFVAEEFLLSFSQPNLYFHAATAYAILRAQGVAIGKRDFLGAVRTRPA